MSDKNTPARIEYPSETPAYYGIRERSGVRVSRTLFGPFETAEAAQGAMSDGIQPGDRLIVLLGQAESDKTLSVQFT
jgi:hypothetical protein